jgi:single-stranded DNA-specific DHH superfamily exonuclease
MKLKFLIGSKEDFLRFLDSIGKKDKVAILTHNDLDGVASAIFLEEILKKKGLEKNLKMIRFLEYKKEVLEGITPELKEKDITKILISDINIDNLNLGDFEALRKDFSVFLIDHHPAGELKDKSNIIKAKTGYCAALICYYLGGGIIDSEKWKWLRDAAVIADASYKDPDVFRMLKKEHPKITEKNIYDSKPGLLSGQVSYALVYYKDGIEKIYELIKKRDFKDLKEACEKVKQSIEETIEKFKENAEFYPERNLYFYYYNPKFNITSIVATMVSNKNPVATFIFVSDSKNEPGFVKVNARNQDCKEDMNWLMKKGVEGLENASGGGHVPAAAARFMKKDLEKFKKNILNS